MSKHIEITYRTAGNPYVLERNEENDNEIDVECKLPKEFHLQAEVWIHDGIIMIYPADIHNIEELKEFIGEK